MPANSRYPDESVKDFKARMAAKGKKGKKGMKGKAKKGNPFKNLSK